jgi:hypothetical protein
VATYDQLPGFEHIYLEDSYLLGVSESHGGLCFDVEAVLTGQHPRWSPGKPGEAYTYLRIAIVFSNPRSVTWLQRPMKPVVGPDGQIDYGNVDSFIWQNGHYELAGEWGRVMIEGEPPSVVEIPLAP